MVVTAARWVQFPPRGRLLVDTTAGSGSSAATTITTACRPTPVAVHHLAWGATRLFGGRMLPGRRRELALDDEPRAVLDEACRAAGSGCVPIAVFERRQANRGGLVALLGRDGSTSAFLKAVPTAVAAGLRREVQALARFDGVDRTVGGRRLVIPSVLVSGETGDWTWVLHRALPNRPHRPATLEDAADVSLVVASALGSTIGGVTAKDEHNLLDPPDAVPAHWRPAHGDYAPWNLRRLGRRSVALFDFEDTLLAPPSADLTYFTLTHAALRGRPPAPGLDVEAVEFWRDRVALRIERGEDPAMNSAILGAIGAAR